MCRQVFLPITLPACPTNLRSRHLFRHRSGKRNHCGKRKLYQKNADFESAHALRSNRLKKVESGRGSNDCSSAFPESCSIHHHVQNLRIGKMKRFFQNSLWPREGATDIVLTGGDHMSSSTVGLMESQICSRLAMIAIATNSSTGAKRCHCRDPCRLMMFLSGSSTNRAKHFLLAINRHVRLLCPF